MTEHTGTHPAVVVLADDLSGAAETASAFLGRRPSVSLHLESGMIREGDADIHVVDLDTRSRTAPEAGQALRNALTAVAPDAMVVTKIDSLLRGHVGEWARVLAERGPVVVAAALPALDRTVRDGVLHVAGVPLHRTRAWHAEPSTPPAAVSDLFANLPTTTIAVGPDLVGRLSAAAEQGRIAVCDAATDDDLDAILRASRAVPHAHLVGTAALAKALARTLPMAAPTVAPTARIAASILMVVGTAEPVAAEQVRRLVATGATRLTLDADDLLGGTVDPAALADALDRGSVVVTIGGDVRPALSGALSSALARFVAAGQSRHSPDLMLTGGATARAVIEAIGVRTLHPVHEVHHGAVASVASDGRTVVTRPGSFGDADSLVAVAAYFAHQTPSVPTQPKAYT
ncbi:four-carbon acid sugar kinase family protein [Mycobacterium sp. NPDC006124]|uniref:four-carbon acid sugar kinase family protein n=1 Tax=Mycobacterium sp. NPDC006124 TaxID=3156729 RepID=UPI0033A6977D